MAMSRKDYVAFAEVIALEIKANIPATKAEQAVIDVAKSMADVFKRDNPNFDRARFLTACGIK